MIDPKTVENIAKLARLHISDEEANQYSQHLSNVLKYFEQISKVKTDGVEPLVTPTDLETFWRADEANKELSAEEIVANAPQKTGNLFTVPPVV
jgi:aspartyl-tRNA(Asn)/glutamyl-tRNA(Gln) amidotransferase subunit C